MPIILESGSLNLLELSGPVQACNRIALPLAYQSLVPTWNRSPDRPARNLIAVPIVLFLSLKVVQIRVPCMIDKQETGLFLL